MNRLDKFLGATFLSAAMLVPAAVQGQGLIGNGDIPPCFLQRNPLSPTIYTACKSWKGNDGAQISAAVGLPAARKKFWDTYPNKPGAAQASQEFADWLFLKDLNYLQAALRDVKTRDASDDPRDFIRMVNGLSLLGLGGSPILDGGIKEDLADEFYDWAKNIREKLGYPGDPLTQGFALGMMGPSIGKAVEASRSQYQKYVVMRDWEEFDAAGREPASFDDPAVYFPIMCVRFQKVSFDTARSEYDGMLKALGDDAIRKAVQQVRAAPQAGGGLLRVSAQEPIKLTPNGNRVPDPSVPQPEGVIGLVSSPIQAVERLAIQGDDRRYLLWLLTQNRPSRSSTIDLATIWQYADSTYRQFVIAFGDQDVLQAARQVRTATKRMTSGGVMDPAAIGATRPDPYRAFEDIVTRKNPRGYVRALLAVKRNLKTGPEVDEAYKNFVAASGEPAVLAAAGKMAAQQPNVNYDGDLDTLTSVLGGSLSLDKPAETLVDDPDYLSWKGFPGGTKVTYVYRGMGRASATSNTLVPGKPALRQIYLLKSIDDKIAELWHTDIAYDPDGTAHQPRDTEVGYPAKMPQPASRGQVATPLDSGQETLTINGRKIPTRWQSVSSPYAGDCTLVTTTWTSDEVPTGLVRKLEETRCTRIPGRINETILESVEGARSGSPGTAAPSENVSTSQPTPVSGAATAPLSKTPAGQGPSQPPSASPAAPSVSASNQASPNAVAPNSAPSTQVPQTPPVQAGTPSTPGVPPDASRAGQLRQRLIADQMRFGKDMSALGQFQRRTRSKPPAEFIQGQLRFNPQLGAANVAIRQGNYGQAEQDLQNAEAALDTMEKSLGN